MAKNKEKEEKVMMTPKEMRRAKFDAAQQQSVAGREQDVRAEFKQYFVKLKRQLNLDSSLEDIFWLHFKSAGFAQKEKFDDGVRHFGYKI